MSVHDKEMENMMKQKILRYKSLKQIYVRDLKKTLKPSHYITDIVYNFVVATKMLNYDMLHKMEGRGGMLLIFLMEHNLSQKIYTI